MKKIIIFVMLMSTLFQSSIGMQSSIKPIELFSSSTLWKGIALLGIALWAIDKGISYYQNHEFYKNQQSIISRIINDEFDTRKEAQNLEISRSVSNLFTAQIRNVKERCATNDFVKEEFTSIRTTLQLVDDIAKANWQVTEKKLDDYKAEVAILLKKVADIEMLKSRDLSIRRCIENVKHEINAKNLTIDSAIIIMRDDLGKLFSTVKSYSSRLRPFDDSITLINENIRDGEAVKRTIEHLKKEVDDFSKEVKFLNNSLGIVKSYIVDYGLHETSKTPDPSPRAISLLQPQFSLENLPHFKKAQESESDDDESLIIYDFQNDSPRSHTSDDNDEEGTST